MISPALYQLHMEDGTIDHSSGIFGHVLEVNGVKVIKETALYLLPSAETISQLSKLSKQLVDRIDFDVNGVQGKGGNGGLTSDDTIRAAGEMRILLSRIGREA